MNWKTKALLSKTRVKIGHLKRLMSMYKNLLQDWPQIKINDREREIRKIHIYGINRKAATTDDTRR